MPILFCVAEFALVAFPADETSGVQSVSTLSLGTVEWVVSTSQSNHLKHLAYRTNLCGTHHAVRRPTVATCVRPLAGPGDERASCSESVGRSNAQAAVPAAVLL